jgi:hypothetical protein
MLVQGYHMLIMATIPSEMRKDSLGSFWACWSIIAMLLLLGAMLLAQEGQMMKHGLYGHLEWHSPQHSTML